MDEGYRPRIIDSDLRRLKDGGYAVREASDRGDVTLVSLEDLYHDVG